MAGEITASPEYRGTTPVLSPPTTYTRVVSLSRLGSTELSTVSTEEMKKTENYEGREIPITL